MDKDYFRDKNILVMGLGRFGGGVDAVKFTCEAGAKVIVTDVAGEKELADSIKQLKDYKNIEYHLGGHSKNDFERTDIVIANPAVPNNNEYLDAARKAGRLVTSQIEIFFEMAPAVIIGITGANGKSTTSALTAHLLRGTRDEGRATVWLSGNIGNEPLLTIVEQISRDDLVVLELSSFQIEQLAQIRKMPKVALLTNLTPNHLDRYGSFEEYCKAKELMFKYQKRWSENEPCVSIFNAEGEIGAEWFEKYRKDGGRICEKFSADDVSGEIRERFGLPGRANLSNLAAAITIARHFGVEDGHIRNCLAAFKALTHRLELVAEKRGVAWYNDSKATTPDSAIVALEAFERPIIIIAGGYDKHIPFNELGAKIAKKARAAILIGQTAKKIAESIHLAAEKKAKVEFADSLAEAVEMANLLAGKGDVVLLSPACASYGMFDNFEQRGNLFAKLVRQLEG